MIGWLPLLVFLLVGSLLTISSLSLFTIRNRAESYKWSFVIMAVITTAYWISLATIF